MKPLPGGLRLICLNTSRHNTGAYMQEPGDADLITASSLLPPPAGQRAVKRGRSSERTTWAVRCVIWSAESERGCGVEGLKNEKAIVLRRTTEQERYDRLPYDGTGCKSPPAAIWNTRREKHEEEHPAARRTGVSICACKRLRCLHGRMASARQVTVWPMPEGRRSRWERRREPTCSNKQRRRDFKRW